MSPLARHVRRDDENVNEKHAYPQPPLAIDGYVILTSKAKDVLFEG